MVKLCTDGRQWPHITNLVDESKQNKKVDSISFNCIYCWSYFFFPQWIRRNGLGVNKFPNRLMVTHKSAGMSSRTLLDCSHLGKKKGEAGHGQWKLKLVLVLNYVVSVHRLGLFAWEPSRFFWKIFVRGGLNQPIFSPFGLPHDCLFFRQHFHAVVHISLLFLPLFIYLLVFSYPSSFLRGSSLIPCKRPDRSESTTRKVYTPTRKRGGKSEECKVVCKRDANDFPYPGQPLLKSFHFHVKRLHHKGLGAAHFYNKKKRGKEKKSWTGS